MECGILKSIYDQCQKSVTGAHTGDMLKIFPDMDALLELLDRMQDEGLITIGSQSRGKGLHTHNKLIAAAHIRISARGKQFLLECEQG